MSITSGILAPLQLLLPQKEEAAFHIHSENIKAIIHTTLQIETFQNFKTNVLTSHALTYHKHDNHKNMVTSLVVPAGTIASFNAFSRAINSGCPAYTGNGHFP